MPIQNKVPVRPAGRNAVYDVLDGERDYQDETFPTSERDLSPGEFLLLLEEYVVKTRARWSKGPEGTDVTVNAFRKIGGIAVRAMEAHGAIPREYHIPQSANIVGTMQARDDNDALSLAPSRLADPRRQG